GEFHSRGFRDFTVLHVGRLKATDEGAFHESIIQRNGGGTVEDLFVAVARTVEVIQKAPSTPLHARKVYPCLPIFLPAGIRARCGALALMGEVYPFVARPDK